MNSKISFLITLYYPRAQTLKQCALKVDRNRLDGDCAEYYMERDNRQQLRELLPLHVKDLGIVVEVTEILDCVVCEL